MLDSRPHIFDLDVDELRTLVGQWGMASYRADQIFDWIYHKHTFEPAQMTNLPAKDRLVLQQRLGFSSGYVVRHEVASDGVQKLLLQWYDSNKALAVADDHSRQSECVMIPSDTRRTACISSQIGCPVGCKFCASGLGGLDGNLTGGQMVEQVRNLTVLQGVGRISHVVFMGMGEPLANFDAVVRAVRVLSADWGFGISGRRITISTVGLPSQMRQLADLQLPVTLALSMHAPNDKLRRELIPWAHNIGIDELIDAGRYYFKCTGREVTLEYILLRMVNDQPVHAQQLVKVAKQLRSNVNLIRYNEVEGIPYARPSSNDTHRFQSILKDAGINTHIRASRGRDIAAACGQLRHERVASG